MSVNLRSGIVRTSLAYHHGRFGNLTKRDTLPFFPGARRACWTDDTFSRLSKSRRSDILVTVANPHYHACAYASLNNDGKESRRQALRSTNGHQPLKMHKHIEEPCGQKPVDLQIEENPQEQTLALIRSHLRDYNESRIGPYPPKKYAVVAYDDQKKFVGGMFGWFQWDWLFIDWAWVDDNARRQGVGTALLQRFEELARERGIGRARLNTASFQEGLAFYKRNGYEVFAELDIRAPGGQEHKDFFLRKTLIVRTD